MRVRFEKPPINELVIATYFNPPLFRLRSEHMGLFWAKIREEFSLVEQQPPVGGAEMLEPVSGEFLSMPRFWFIAEDGINLIQLQKNAFMMNWRRREANYPHYAENLKPTFDRYYRLFEDFLSDDVGVSELKIDMCELTYINTIESCEYWQGPQDTNKVIPSFSVPDIKINLSSNPAFNCVYAYAINSDLQLRVTIRNGEAAQKPGTPVLILEIKAVGRIGGAAKSKADEWFERAHDAIVTCFVNVTNRDIQHSYWQATGADI